MINIFHYDGNLGASYANPQAATSIADSSGNTRTLAYDQHGDLAGDQVADALDPLSVRSYSWDAAGRMTGSVTAAAAGAKTLSYGYGQDGARLTLSDGTGTTYYSSDAFNRTRQGGAVTDTEKHVSAGGLPVAAVQGTGAAAV